jgi:hypothetical protein
MHNTDPHTIFTIHSKELTYGQDLLKKKITVFVSELFKRCDRCDAKFELASLLEKQTYGATASLIPNSANQKEIGLLLIYSI